MPKLIGNAPPHGATPASFSLIGYLNLTKLSYSQMVLMPPRQIYYHLDTTDRGGPRVYAKRWYTWWAYPPDILNNPRSTPKMLAKARNDMKAMGVGK